MSRVIQLLLIASFVCFAPISAFANHGPATSGGGASTVSGETLDAGKVAISIEENYTNYENLSSAEAQEKAGDGGHFDGLRDSFLTSMSLSYGITDDLQLDAGLGWYSGRDFFSVEGGHHDDVEEDGHGDSEGERQSANPEGLTDLYLRAKYRMLKGNPGNLSLLGGVILPTGKDDELFSDGEKLEPSSQPGTGAYGFQVGLAYSRFLTSRVTVDASSLHTIRTKEDRFKVGDRNDTALALSYRFTESIQSFPQFGSFLEFGYTWLEKDEEADGWNPNSGGNYLFVSPGVRVRFSERIGLTVAPSLPMIQDSNGEQVETDFRVGAQLGISL